MTACAAAWRQRFQGLGKTPLYYRKLLFRIADSGSRRSATDASAPPFRQMTSLRLLLNIEKLCRHSASIFVTASHSLSKTEIHL
jgi:hypothetical protein